jgi:adenine-specific DNA-methyltransferase
LGEVIGHLGRVMQDGASVFWQTGYTQTEGGIQPIDMHTHALFQEAGFTLWDRIIWHYLGGKAFRDKFTNRHETIMWYWKPGGGRPAFTVDPIRVALAEHDARNNFWGRNPSNVWTVDRVAFGSKTQTEHIAVFPEAVSERILRACTRPGDLVLDPFSGSGTVAKVAHSLGRDWLA